MVSRIHDWCKTDQLLWCNECACKVIEKQPETNVLCKAASEACLQETVMENLMRVHFHPDHTDQTVQHSICKNPGDVLVCSKLGMPWTL
jgi:hypothetical protein